MSISRKRFAANFKVLALAGLVVGGSAGTAPPAAGESTPVVVLPRLVSGTTESFFSLELKTGQIAFTDRLRKDPLVLRSRRLPDNLFSKIGRPADQPAAPGEILFSLIHDSSSTVRAALFVEASTGYAAYFDQPGRIEGQLGEFTNLLGRPFGPIAAADNNFALLMRRGNSGKTEGAYLYHGTSGRGLYLSQVDKLSFEPTVVPTDPWPQLSGPLAAVELQGPSRETRGYLLLDGATGELHWLTLTSGAPVTIGVQKGALNLFQAFANQDPATATGRLFVATSLQGRGEETLQVFVLDTVSGDMAILDGVQGGNSQPSFTKLSQNLFAGLSPTPEVRPFVALPRNSSGTTLGVWIYDSLTRNLFYIDQPSTPAATTVRLVRFEGG